jgi:hypothetical protein
MVTNVNFPAPLQVLALLGTVFVIVVCGAAAMYGGLTKRKWTKLALTTIAVVVGIYVILLFSMSLASHERVLGLGEEKHFCEIDCHIAYAVLGVQEYVGEGSEKSWLVRLRTRFDEATISERRPKDATLMPNPRKILLVDESGAEYMPERINPSLDQSRRFGEALRTGEAYVNVLEFRVPAQLQRAKLLLMATDGPEALLIGSEASPLHRRIYFKIEPQSAAN